MKVSLPFAFRLSALVILAATPATAEINLSPTTTNISASGGSSSVQVINSEQSGTWTAESGASWVTITSAASGTGSGTIQYTVAGNPSAAARQTTLTVRPSSGASKTLTINQLGGELNISPSSANVSNTGGSGTVTVNSSDSSLQWIATSNQPWLLVTSGASGIGPGSVQWSAGPNTTNSSRTATITVTPLDGIGITFLVNQQAGSQSNTISASPSSVNADAAGSTGSVQVIITPQMSWTATSNQLWLTISSGGSGQGNSSLQYSVSPNPSAAVRTAFLTITHSQGPTTTVPFTQSGGVLVVSPSSANVSAQGGNGAVSLSTTSTALQWSAVSDQEWLTVAPASGAGAQTLQWTAAANPGTQGRSATITIVAGGGTAQIFTVNQQAGEAGSLSLNPGSASVPPSVATGSFQIVATQALAWTAISNQQWLTITSNNSGTGSGTISYSVAGAVSAAPRTGAITVTASSVPAAVFTVTQAGAQLTIDPSAATPPGSGGSGTFSISTNNSTLRWIAASSETWLSIGTATSGAGDAVVGWTGAANTTAADRTATITITPEDGEGVPFTVRQQGSTGTIIAAPNSVTFSYQELGTLPAAAQVTITSGGDVLLPLSVTVTTSGGGNWLKVSGGGSTPAVLTISVDPSGLAQGTHTGAISISSSAATNSPLNVPVTLTVSPSAVLVSRPNDLSFAFQQNGPAPTSQIITLTTSTGGNIAYSISQDPSATWLSASGSGSAPSSLTVTVNPTGLQPGKYQGAVIIQAPAAGNSPFRIPVTLDVSAAPSLVATPAAFSITYRRQGPGTDPVSIAVSSTGASLSFTAAPSVPWLSVSDVTANSVRISINPENLAVGTHQGSIVLTSQEAANSPLRVPVTFIVEPAHSLTADPTHVNFTLAQGGTSSATIALSAASSIAFTPAVQTSSGGNWLSVRSSATQTPAVLTVSAQAGSLAVGSYAGTITLTAPEAGNSPVTIPVTLTIAAQPSLVAAPGNLTFAYRIANGSSSLPSQAVLVSSQANLEAPLSTSVSTVTGGDWLSISGVGTTPSVIQVMVNAASLPAGDYSGSVTFTSAGHQAVTLPVSLKVTAAPVVTIVPASLAFHYQQGGTSPQPQAVSVTSGASLLFSVSFSVSTESANTWLAVTGGGQTPGNVSVSVDPTNLTPGTYQATLSISTPQAGNNHIAIPVSLTVSAAPNIVAQPSSLTFTYTQHGPAPAPQGLSLSSSQTLAFSTSISSSGPWVAAPASGTTPTSLQISVDPSGLTQGRYNAVIVITAPGASNNPFTVPLSLEVKAASELMPSLSRFTFSYQLLGAAPTDQAFVVTSPDTSLIVTASVSTESGGDWLSVSGGGNAPAAFTLRVNPAGLQPGTYSGSVTIDSSGASNTPISLPVTLLVTAAPVLRASPSQLLISYQLGATAPVIAPIQITTGITNTLRTSGDTVAFQATATTDSGGPWLQLTGGSITPAALTPTINPSGLRPGVYTGSISISSAQVGNSPLTIPVTLTVTSEIVLLGSPTSLSFAAQQNAPPPAQQVLRCTSSGSAINFSYSVSPGANWLTVTGATGTPADLNVSVSTAGLAPGRYSALILAQSDLAANSPVQIPVTLDVSGGPMLIASPSLVRFAHIVGGQKPAPQSLSVSSSGAPMDFTASVNSGPAWLFASGSSTTPGVVQVEVDPGQLAPGEYSGTVTIASPAAGGPLQVPVILTVSTAPVLIAEPVALNFAYQLGGPAPVNQSLVAMIDAGSATLTATAQTITGGNWLSVAGGGATPTFFIVGVNPAGLAAGTYKGQIVLTSPGISNGPLSVSVTLRVTDARLLTLTPEKLSFDAQLNGAAPPNRQITIRSSNGVAVSVTAQPSFGINWLSVVSDSTTTPAILTVSVNPANLPAGRYIGSLIVTSPGAGNSPLVVPVMLRIFGTPALQASPPAAVVSAAIGASPPSVTIAITSTIEPIRFSAAASPGTPWLNVTGAGTTPSTITISVNTVGLAPGAYHGVAIVTSEGLNRLILPIPVDLLVSSTPLLSVAPTSLNFSATGQGLAPAQTLRVTSGASTMAISVSASPGTRWLRVAGGGTTPQSITVLADATGLSPGTYLGSVRITAVGAANSPLSVPVSLMVASTPSLQSNPPSLTFEYNSSVPHPTEQSLSVTLGGQPATQSVPTAALGSPWLSAQKGSNGATSVRVNPSGLLPGSYSGTVLITAPGASNSPLVVPVNFQVSGVPDFDISQQAIALIEATAAGPVSTQIQLGNLTQVSADIELNVTASTWLSVSPTRARTPFVLTITADPTGLRPGSYSGSIIASSAGSTIQTIPVELSVADQPGLNVAPQLVTFAYFSGGDLPRPIDLNFIRFSDRYFARVVSSEPWLTVNPASPTASGPIRLQAEPAGLSRGVHRALLNVSLSETAEEPPLFVKEVSVEFFVDQPADPRISFVTSGMSFLGGPIAPGQIITIFGSGLGPVAQVNSQIESVQVGLEGLTQTRLARSIAGVQVLINGILCPLIYVSESQVNAIAPYALYMKNSASIAVRYNGVLSSEFPVTVSSSAPGLFSASQAGAGPGAILNQDMSHNTSANPAAKGSTISLFGGGAGQTEPQGMDGLIATASPLPKPLLPVSVIIGGVLATDVTYVGGSPELTEGALQINVRVPETVPSGEIPVIVKIGDAISPGGLTVNVR